MFNAIALQHGFDQIIRLPVVISLTGKCKSLIYAEIKAGRFPRQKKLGKRSVGWSLLEIQDYIRVTLAGGEYFAA